MSTESVTLKNLATIVAIGLSVITLLINFLSLPKDSSNYIYPDSYIYRLQVDILDNTSELGHKQNPAVSFYDFKPEAYAKVSYPFLLAAISNIAQTDIGDFIDTLNIILYILSIFLVYLSVNRLTDYRYHSDQSRNRNRALLGFVLAIAIPFTSLITIFWMKYLIGEYLHIFLLTGLSYSILLFNSNIHKDHKNKLSAMLLVISTLLALVIMNRPEFFIYVALCFAYVGYILVTSNLESSVKRKLIRVLALTLFSLIACWWYVVKYLFGYQLYSQEYIGPGLVVFEFILMLIILFANYKSNITIRPSEVQLISILISLHRVLLNSLLFLLILTAIIFLVQLFGGSVGLEGGLGHLNIFYNSTLLLRHNPLAFIGLLLFTLYSLDPKGTNPRSLTEESLSLVLYQCVSIFALLFYYAIYAYINVYNSRYILDIYAFVFPLALLGILQFNQSDGKSHKV